MANEVTVERDGHVLLIGVNRPEKRNAWNLAVIDAMSQAYELLAEDDDLRVGVVFGHGDHFSAGLDLAEVGAAVKEHGPGRMGGLSKYDPFGVWAPSIPKPIVIALNGISFTLSIELALASDIVVAADDVRLRQLEIGRGIMPFGGGTFRGPAQLGWGNAMHFLLTADEFGAEQARHIGLVQEVVPAGEHVKRATEIAQTIARQAPRGVQATLANARIVRANAEKGVTEHLAEVLPGIMTSKDAEEGLLSFLERREAAFSGE